MPRLTLALVALIATAAPALADRVTDRAAFLSAVEGRALTTTGISLTVTPDGRIDGRAFGRAVSGAWTWERGWFCRTLAWGSREWPRNCQLVEVAGNAITFTADKGAGDRARMAIR